jgi:hypothetical protein
LFVAFGVYQKLVVSEATPSTWRAMEDSVLFTQYNNDNVRLIAITVGALKFWYCLHIFSARVPVEV